jgi:uncharacterized iron-regulated membrane protein
MRNFHRWFSLPLIIFLFLVTATGVVLQFQEMDGVTDRRPKPPTQSALPADAELLAYVQKAITAARAAKADFPAQRVELDFSKGQAQARFGVSSRGGPSIEVDLKTGEAKLASAPKRSLHALMIQLHNGSFFGPVGLIITMLVSIVLLVLTVTGFLVYLDMWQRRRSAGKTGFFWK